MNTGFDEEIIQCVIRQKEESKIYTLCIYISETGSLITVGGEKDHCSLGWHASIIIVLCFQLTLKRLEKIYISHEPTDNGPW